MVKGVCSNKPRPSVQNSRNQGNLKTCASAWGKDVWHIQKSGVSTLCGIDCSEWIRMGEMNIDHHLCDKCRKKQNDDQ